MSGQEDTFEMRSPMSTPPKIKDFSAEIDASTMPHMCFWHVCLYVPAISLETEGGIALPSSTLKNQEHMTVAGKIIAVGPKAFKDPRLLTEGMDNIPQLGEWVLIGQYSGMRIRTRQGHQLRMITDSSIICTIDDPNDYVTLI